MVSLVEFVDEVSEFEVGGQVLVDLVGGGQVEFHHGVGRGHVLDGIFGISPLAAVGASEHGHGEGVGQISKEADVFDAGLNAPGAGDGVMSGALRIEETVFTGSKVEGGMEAAADGRNPVLMNGLGVAVVAGAVPGAQNGSAVGGSVGSLGLHVPAGAVKQPGGVIRHAAVSAGELQHEGIEVVHGGGHAEPVGVAAAGKAAVVVGIGLVGAVVDGAVHGIGRDGEAVELHGGGHGEHVGFVGAAGVVVVIVHYVVIGDIGALIVSPFVVVAGAHPEGGHVEPVGHGGGEHHAVAAVQAGMHDGVFAEGVFGKADELLAHADRDGGLGDEPVDVGLADAEIGLGVVGGAPVVVGRFSADAGLHLHIAGKVFRSGEGHAETQALPGAVIVVGGVDSLTGDEGEHIFSVHLHVHGGRRGGRGNNHAGSQKKSGKLFHCSHSFEKKWLNNTSMENPSFSMSGA